MVSADIIIAAIEAAIGRDHPATHPYTDFEYQTVATIDGNLDLVAVAEELDKRIAPTEDAYVNACRALHWRTAQLRAHGIEPIRLAHDAEHNPPEDFDFLAAEAKERRADES